MGEHKMCRICMTKENLSSIFSIMDGSKISDKINFVCGQKISSSDTLPKLICHQCLSSIIIASSIKRKSLETEKIFQDMHDEDDDDVEYIEQSFTDEEEDDNLLEEFNDPLRSRFLVYEADPEIENQPKMNYNLSETSMKINSTNHFNYNPELKSFVENYLVKKPNLEIIKITDPACVKDIERVLAINDNVKDASHAKRQRQSFVSQSGSRNNPTQPTSSRLLNALSGHRLGNVTVNRISSPSINVMSRKSINNRN